MATLVLTAVGGAIGGPVGAAIGGLLGGFADRALLAPKGREGPRLTELSVQTSSYGTQIPWIFGTMRVAGTVIWSTDLIESRATGSAGKGQPSVTTYSYSASFAVLLSGRPIRSVGRIWADGNLLRGSAGDFKASTGFRLHTGGEDQPVDPLIASAEGGLTPAHRGCAYAVFEGLALADYGNRIPSLTFEVTADDGPRAIGAIAQALAPEVTVDAALMLDGFAASGGSVRAVLETLGDVGGAWFSPQGRAVVMRDSATNPVAIADCGFAADAKGIRRARSMAAASGIPAAIAVSHYDPARDYQIGLQRARRPGAGVSESRIEVPAAIAAGTAKSIATAMLARAETGRTTRSVAAAIDALAIGPGACVTIRGEPGVWRVTKARLEAMVVTLDLVALAPASLSAPATSGRALATPDLTIGATWLQAFEMPALDDTLLTAPRIAVAATGAGAGWRRAALLYSLDDGASWAAAGATASPAILGTIEVPPDPAASAAFYDLRSAVVVRLAHADLVLGDADDAALDRGRNLALIGDELVQFGRAEPLGGTGWRLSRLLRGRRGTEAAMGAQAAGARFVLVEADTVRTLDLPLSALGQRVRVLASGVGDTKGPVESAFALTGASIRPPAPVHLAVATDGSGDATLRWTRRSRAGWRWIDGVDAPLGEEAERYRVALTLGDGSTRTIETTEPLVTIAAADRAAGPITAAVRQRGTVAESLPAGITIASSTGGHA
ncbi:MULTISPECIES: phage tail protein [unclassified Sphingomonas]|uniref:phage tail protein n=1 Tax=unclassified Sphingomonas TaxID=196159 RepID=UPI00226A3084|nr:MULTISPECIES: phage tail protein [unclassified Sphingomonas]